MVCAEGASDLLLDLEHAQILLGLVVVEGDAEVVKEGEDLPLPEGEAFEQIARLRQPSPQPAGIRPSDERLTAVDLQLAAVRRLGFALDAIRSRG